GNKFLLKNGLISITGGLILYVKYIKRFIDIVLSVIAIIIFFPMMLIVAILVRLNLGKPIIFKQDRVGLNERIFTLYKFRSMSDKTDEFGELLPKNNRLTKFGKIIRSTSLDELPELFNILKGDMSIIGPRPLLVEYLPRYNNHQKTRHNISPRLSSYAAVNGRASLDWETSVDLDVWYVDNVTFWLDIKIIIKTIVTVFKRENINSDRGKFKGNENGKQGE